MISELPTPFAAIHVSLREFNAALQRILAACKPFPCYSMQLGIEVDSRAWRNSMSLGSVQAGRSRAGQE